MYEITFHTALPTILLKWDISFLQQQLRTLLTVCRTCWYTDWNIRSKVLVKCAASTFTAEQQVKGFIHIYLKKKVMAKQLGTAAVGGTTGTEAWTDGRCHWWWGVGICKKKKSVGKAEYIKVKNSNYIYQEKEDKMELKNKGTAARRRVLAEIEIKKITGPQVKGKNDEAEGPSAEKCWS